MTRSIKYYIQESLKEKTNLRTVAKPPEYDEESKLSHGRRHKPVTPEHKRKRQAGGSGG